MSKKEEKKGLVEGIDGVSVPDSTSDPETKFVSSSAGTRASEDGMKYDPIRGTDVPTHYPAAVVINDSEGEMVKAPTVTPATHNNKMNPQDAKTTDSEYIVRAPDMETANRLAEEGRSELPKADQDTTRSGDK
jgi:hypothetical protein